MHTGIYPAMRVLCVCVRMYMHILYVCVRVYICVYASPSPQKLADLLACAHTHTHSLCPLNPIYAHTLCSIYNLEQHFRMSLFKILGNESHILHEKSHISDENSHILHKKSPPVGLSLSASFLRTPSLSRALCLFHLLSLSRMRARSLPLFLNHTALYTCRSRVMSHL